MALRSAGFARIRRMSVVAAWLCLVAACLWRPAWAAPQEALAPEKEIERLRQELDQVKAAYEAAVKAMESRLAALEEKAKKTEEKNEAAKSLPDSARNLASGFAFGGYLRSGFGVNGAGGVMEAFQAPGAHAKYRLGNEPETYGELVFAKNWEQEAATEPYFRTQVRLSFSNAHFDSLTAGNVDVFAIREAYSQMGNFDWAPEVSFWAGQRFYRRKQIYIDDYYWLDMSGFGGGVEDVPVWNVGRLALAFLGGSSDRYRFADVGYVAKNALDLRLYDVNVPLGQGMFWLTGSLVKGGTYANSATNTTSRYPDANGFAAGFAHSRPDFLGLTDGYQEVSVQYGRGTSSDFTTNIQNPTSGLADAWRFQVTASGLAQVSESLSVMPVFVFDHRDNGAAWRAQTMWVSGGLRPTWHVSEHFAVAVEGGLDWVANQPDNAYGTLYKITLAPELTISKNVMGRPVLRAFSTYANWTDGLKRKVGGAPYCHSLDGASFGLQMEAWW